jgi:drug/metabolite transporter (DMT)-like permease
MKWMFLFATILSYPVLHKSVIETSFSSLDGSVWLRIGFIVIFATFISYLLIPVGQKTIRPTTLSMYNYMQPVVASLVAVGLGMDTFGYEKIVSTVLVFAGVYIVTQSKSRAQIELEKLRKQGQ